MKKNLFEKTTDDFSLITIKLTNGKENLKIPLGSQIQSLSKHGLGYNMFSKKKASKTVSVKQGYLKNYACSYCGIHGHYAFSCKLRQTRHVGVKQIWVPKGIILSNSMNINRKGPKKI